MADTNPKKDQPVTVEDLLRLKRHEQPEEAFWARFDRELHEKTLRTLVKKKPSPRGFWALLGRWQASLPLAGAAAFALTLSISNNLVTLPVSSAPVEVAAMAPAVQATPEVTSTVVSQPEGSPGYVVSALPSQQAFSQSRYTQVPASRALTPAHRPEVQFVGGAVATSIPHTGFVAGIY